MQRPDKSPVRDEYVQKESSVPGLRCRPHTVTLHLTGTTVVCDRLPEHVHENSDRDQVQAVWNWLRDQVQAVWNWLRDQVQMALYLHRDQVQTRPPTFHNKAKYAVETRRVQTTGPGHGSNPKTLGRTESHKTKSNVSRGKARRA
jgi:hypothetical protein